MASSSTTPKPCSGLNLSLLRCQAEPDDDDSVGQLEVGLFNLSRLRFRSAKQLPNLECSGFCVSRNAMLSYSKVRNMDRMTVGLGGRVELALSLTALMAVGRFETYQESTRDR